MSDKEPVVTTAAVPMADATEVAMRDQEKQGGKCCGCLCDYRRAVVVISIIYMINYFISCILWFTGATTAVLFGAATRDNEDVDSDAALVAGGAAYIVGSFAIVFFFCNLFVLCAALRYSTCMLTTTILIVLIQFGFSIWQTIETQNQIQKSADEYNFETNTAAGLAGGIIAAIIGYGLYLYPLIGLIMEIKKGIMSRETYPREAYSCCCRPRV